MTMDSFEALRSERWKDVKDLMVFAVWTGLVTGLVEGVGWLVIQRFDRLTQLWTQVLWIAPIFDGVLFALLGVTLAMGWRIVPRRWWRTTAFFAVACAWGINLVSLILGPYVYRWVLVIVALGLAVNAVSIFRRHEAKGLRMMRRTLPVLVGVVLALFLGVQGFYVMRERLDTGALPDADPDAPDVVVIIVDALRADHLSSYGYTRATSPFFDEVAHDGVLFERAIASSSYSLPSHASMLSGLHLYEHGTTWLEFNVFRDAKYPSIAEAMRDRGYRTGAFSANPFWFTREQGFGRGFLHFEDFYHSVADMAYRTIFGNNFLTLRLALGFAQVPARKWGGENTDRILRWVGRDDEHPFFAVANYFDVHAPYTPPQPYRSMFSQEENPGGILNWLMDRRGDIRLTPEERQSEIDAYDGAIAYANTEIRRLFDEIRSTRPGRDLLLVITSDHGEAFDEHGGYLHARSLYREELHIPLIIRGPGVPAGVRIARPVSMTSIPATILDLVSEGRTETFGSPSLATLWRDSTAAASWPYPLAEAVQRSWADPSFPMQHGDMRSVVSPEWHYIAHSVFPTELYSWDDTVEAHDRAKDPETAPLIREFESILKAATIPSQDALSSAIGGLTHVN